MYRYIDSYMCGATLYSDQVDNRTTHKYARRSTIALMADNNHKTQTQHVIYYLHRQMKHNSHHFDPSQMEIRSVCSVWQFCPTPCSCNKLKLLVLQLRAL